MQRKITLLFTLSALMVVASLKAEKTDSSKIYFENAFTELKSMIEDKQLPVFERAVFLSENAYWGNKYSYDDFKQAIDNNLFFINQIIALNDKSDTLNFSVKVNTNGRFKVDDMRYTEKEKKELYSNVLKNWAIFTYITDTTFSQVVNSNSFFSLLHSPFSYAVNDPFGMKDWSNSQVLNLLTSKEPKGNCFALTGLYKIFADRLNTGAKICTAPQHIYIQHQDYKGDYYNVELATAGHPGDGMIQTLTYTTNEAIMSGIALRSFNEKENIGLCLVNLAKAYEHKFNTRNDGFILKCAELVLKNDPLNLNALLLKQQVLDEKVRSYALKNHINDINNLKKDSRISGTLSLLQEHTSKLYELGYRQMPLDMQQMILSGFSNENVASLYADKNPSPFTTVKPKDKNDEIYWTLSHGTLPEVIENKKLETYRHFTFNTETKMITSIDTANTKGFLIDPVVFAYDFGARMYDARLGIFISPDPSAAKYPAVSPYVAMLNNPINVIDPDGRDAIYIAFPDYKADGYPMTGHAGVLLIDNKTGLTKYYEYGRYDKAKLGVVKSYEVSNLVMGADGRPTTESLNKVMQQISKNSGKGQRIEGAYIESDKFKEMNDYAQKKLKENDDPKREPYSITGNNCGTFACDVIEQDKTLDTPTIMDPRPVSIVEEYQDEFTPLSFDPKSGTSIKFEPKADKSGDSPKKKN